MLIYVKSQWYTTIWICNAKRQFMFPTGIKFAFITLVYTEHILLQNSKSNK